MQLTTSLPLALAGVRWRQGQQITNRNRYPDELRWLLDRGSLTARLKRRAETFRVIRLASETRSIYNHERRIFASACNVRVHTAIVREVILCCDGHAAVYARTVIPWSSLAGSNRRLLTLNERPLADVLFSGCGVARGDIEVAQVRTSMPGSERLHARRSLFFPNQKPILVAEFFAGDFNFCTTEE
ncbi:chorismate--pyruvate lyase family protein [Allohahella marinimesophila]|uniref:Probable chorismate pyruvate-lyase n=1 Tax=Allohahella marinimesophila TaxID=1054972 RepID=A0ABP7PUT1_9GAMM